MVLIKADHYTYGIHPDELGYSIKTWSDEIWSYENAKFYERKFEYVEFLTVPKVGEARGLIKLRENGREKIVLSLFKGGVRDKSNRRGVYSHHISIDSEDYIKIGANPRLIEKYFIKDVEEYEKFVRSVKLKGKADPIQIEIDETCRYKVEGKIENYIKSKNTLKNILATLLKRGKFKEKRLKLLCRGRDAKTLIEILYALLELLPPKQRVIQFSTQPVIKNESEFGLILLTEGPLKREWKIIDIDKEMEFTQRDNLDKFIEYVINRYFEKGCEAFREDYTIWEKLENEYKDLEECARMFVHKIIIAKYSVEDLLIKAKEDFENNRFLDAESLAQEVIIRIERITNNELKKQTFLSASEIILKVAERQKRFGDSLHNIIIKANSIFQKKQKTEIILRLREKFPNYGYEISSYLENEDFSSLSFSTQIDIFHKYFENIEPIKIIDDLVTIDYTSTYPYKALIIIFKNRSNIHDEFRDTIKFIITKIIDSLDEVIIRSPFHTPKLDERASLTAFLRLFTSNIIVLLLYLTENFGLKDHVKKLRKIQENFIDILFSLSTTKDFEVFLEKEGWSK